MDRGAVYYAKADGSLIKVVASPTVNANGCSLSPDGRKLYFAETEAARLWEMDILAPGEVRREPWPSPHGGRLLGWAGGIYHRLDSMAVDSAGNVCVATLIHGGITVYSPDGKGWKHIPMPDLYTTNICFGGPDLRTGLRDAVMHGQAGRVRMGMPGAAPQLPVMRAQGRLPVKRSMLGSGRSCIAIAGKETTKASMDSFDYVIVGAGSAGSVLANRLSEDAGTSVCVLEGGTS
jgi:hypothetical protein